MVLVFVAIAVLAVAGIILACIALLFAVEWVDRNVGTPCGVLLHA